MTIENATQQIVSWHQGIEGYCHWINMKLSAMKNLILTLQTMIQDQKEVIEKQNELLQELTKRLIEQD